MRTNRMTVLLAAAGLAVVTACSNSPSSPTAQAVVPAPNFSVGDATSSTAEAGMLKICKAGNIGGTFEINSTPYVGGSGSPTIDTPLTVENGNCVVAATDPGPAENGDFFSVSEDAAADPANTTQELTSCVGLEGAIPCNDSYFVNSIHGVVLTYTNTYTPPPPPPTGCTYTKGWYRNHGASTITGVDGLSTDVEGAIFAATPGKPGPVTWEGGNDVLNLVQQLLAALENGGESGPQSVQDAISAAEAGTSVVGYAISTSLSQSDVSSLIDALSDFNEGKLGGWPHC